MITYEKLDYSVGEFAHITTKYKRYVELVEKLSPDFVTAEILPAFLNDAELTEFISVMEDRLPPTQ